MWQTLYVQMLQVSHSPMSEEVLTLVSRMVFKSVNISLVYSSNYSEYFEIIPITLMIQIEKLSRLQSFSYILKSPCEYFLDA